MPRHRLLAIATLLCLIAATPALAQAQAYERKYNTLTHRILDFESTACEVTDKHYRVLDRLIDAAVDRIDYDASATDLEANEAQALRILRAIAQTLDDHDFRLRVPTTNLCDALTSHRDDDGEYYYYDCDTSSFIYLGIADVLDLPLSFIEVSNPGEPSNHNFVRWDLGGGVFLDWDTNDKAARAFTHPSGIYGTPFSQGPMYAYLLYMRAEAWALRGERSKAISSYRLSYLVCPGAPNATNDLAWAFVTDEQVEQHISPEEALEYAEHAVSVDRDPNHLDTLAAVHAQLGDFTMAVKLQREAVRAALPHVRAIYQTTLDGYRRGETVRAQTRNAEDAG